MPVLFSICFCQIHMPNECVSITKTLIMGIKLMTERYKKNTHIKSKGREKISITNWIHIFSWVSGQLSPEENCSPFMVGIWVKVKVSFRVGGGVQPDDRPRGKLTPRWELGFALVLGLVAIFLGGNCPRTILLHNNDCKTFYIDILTCCRLTLIYCMYFSIMLTIRSVVLKSVLD